MVSIKDNHTGPYQPTELSSVWFFSPSSSSPSSAFSLPWLILPKINRRRSKSPVTARQQPTAVKINRYRSISHDNERK
ncbi:hypothetical protein BHE74_00049252 [Ensete ventricosum]|nr:hypothetical protein BHE74_00049252 [Ensete ventricosum]